MKLWMFVAAIGVLASLALAQPDTVWVRRLNGSGDSADYVEAYGPCIALDGASNVVVTGATTESAGGLDFVTIKYDANGDVLWTARYNGPDNDADVACAVAIDRDGSVYVTGSSAGSDTAGDYATVKYSSSGSEVWTARYNGPGDGDDFARRVVVDASGNVYVTGYSIGAGSGEDFATVKYNPAGTQQWAVRYDGYGRDDRAFALAVDNTGNVYAGGVTDNGTSQDFALVKYGPAGNQVWVRTYNGSANGTDEIKAMVLDTAGAVYVTGNSWGNGFDLATLKYDFDGNLGWASRYDGPAQAYDKATDIFLAGGVYVTGRSTGLTTGVDYVTLKLDPGTGSPIWTARYSNPVLDSGDRAYAVVVDRRGYVYVTGRSWGQGTDEDFATVVYDPAGTEMWASRYDGPASGPDRAYGAAVTASGDALYVTGESWGGSSDFDIVTVKYVPPGAVEESPTTRPTATRVATIASGVLSLPSMPAGLRYSLLDMTGRRTQDLHAGTNDVRHLSPGVYFVRGGAAVRSVVITR
jgi:hypothetical protein